MKPLDETISEATWTSICSLLGIKGGDEELRRALGHRMAIYRQDRTAGGDARSASVKQLLVECSAQAETFASALGRIIGSEDPSASEAQLLIQEIEDVQDLLGTVVFLRDRCKERASKIEDAGGRSSKHYRDLFLSQLNRTLDTLTPKPTDMLRAEVAIFLMREAGETHPPADVSVVSYLRALRTPAR